MHPHHPIQVAILQAQLMQAKAQLSIQGIAAHSPVSHSHHLWPDSASISALLRQDTRRPGGPLPLDDCFMPELMAGFRDVDVAAQHCASKADAGEELQYLAQAMMRSPNYSMSM